MRYGPQHHGFRVGRVGRQAVPELAGRRRRPREAELLLVPRPPHGPHRVERVQGHGRVVPDLRPEERYGHGRRDPGSAPARASARTTRTARSTSTTTSRWRSSTAVSTTASPIHQDMHDGMGEFPAAKNPRKHPEWWGKTFYKHFPNHGFVGDIFTVNGTGVAGAGGQAAQVPVPVPRRLGVPDLRVQVDELDAGPEVVGLARLRRRRAAGPVPHPGRPAVHEVHPDRLRRWPAAGADPA